MSRRRHGAVRALAAALVLTIPATALAAGRPGGERAAGPVARPAPARPAAPPPRPAPAAAPARPAAGGGFNFNHDIAPAPRPVVQQQPRPVVQQQPRPVVQQAPRPTVQQQPRPVVQARPGGQRTAPVTRTAPNAAGSGPHTGHFHGPVVANPQHWNGSWTWNRGVAWRPAPTYWGGGFWGPWALGALAGTVLFGAIIDAESQTQYPSYQVEPESPGAQLLQNYGLQQTPCGPPDLVVIWGPDNSVICTFPNANVGPGDYELDPATLTLTSESQ